MMPSKDYLLISVMLLVCVMEGVLCEPQEINFCNNSIKCEGSHEKTCADQYLDYEICECGEFRVGTNCSEKVHFYLVNKDLPYEEGKRYCEDAGLGKMALILSDQHSLVAQHLLDSSGKDSFVGGSIDPPESNTWDNGMWLDYTPISSWTNWHETSREPETEKVIYMLKEGGWEDRKATDKKKLLCQKIYTCEGAPPDMDKATKMLSTFNTYSETYEYQCDVGYRTNASENGFQYTRCRGGVWQTPLPCYLKDCGPPLSDPNAQVTYSATTYGSSVNYACNIGFSSLGSLSRNITCLSTSQWETYSPCERLSCGQPPLDYMSTVDSDGIEIANIYNTPKNLTMYNANLTYTCNPGFGINGSTTIMNETIRCTADGSWQEHVYCSHKVCGIPEADNNATQIGNATEFSSSVKFICLPGYLVGGDNGATSYEVTCNSNAIWTSHTPCLKISCQGEYDSDSNANITIFGNLFEDIIRYECHPGYVISGVGALYDEIQCRANGTWQSHAPCDRISCGFPANDSNAAFSYIEGWYGDNITYTCHTGYRLGVLQLSGEHVTCQENGKWFPHQFCFKLSCGEPSDDPYATMNITDLDYLYGSNVTYSCHVGYRINYSGPSTETITCLDTGYWSSHTHCVLTPCGIPPYDANAHINYTSTKYMDVANYTCNAGYRLAGNGSLMESIICGANGNWSLHTSCLAVSCGTPVDDPMANLSWSSELYLSQTTYDCLYGYVTLNGSTSETTTCLAEGHWSNHTRCTRISCGSPEEDSNSISTSSDNLYESNITYSCNYGYRIGESNETIEVIQCLGNGSWSMHVACRRVSCGSPPIDGNSTVSSDNFLYNSVVGYTCNTGYYIGNTSDQFENITCQGNGTWTSHTYCEKISCGLPSHDANAESTTSDHLYGSNITYTCHEGYDIASLGTNRETISCQADGSWSNHTECQRISCESPENDDNSVMTLEDYLYESNVTYTCNKGYLIGGETDQSENITCQADGSWTNHTQCRKISCGVPTTDSNANMSLSDNLYGANVTYTCNTGYLIGGMFGVTDTITCMDNKTWTNHTMCFPVSCGSPPSDEFSTSATPFGQFFGSNVTYTCHAGYLIGSVGDPQETITCQSNGTWTSHTPCQRLSCGNSSIDLNSTMITTDNLFESNTTYTCSDGYLIGGNTSKSETIRCQENGYWSNHTLCLPISCGSPIIDVNANMTASDTDNIYGSNITYTCDVGYLIAGTSTNVETIHCDAQGQWTNHSICEKISCRHPQVDVYANITGDENTFGSMFFYKCLEGHVLNGTSYVEDNVTCTIDGNWTTHIPCVPISCGSLNISQNVTVAVDSLLYNSTANFSCSTGHISRSSGLTSGSVTCLSNGTWSDVINCVPVSCGSPPIDLNSNVSYTDTLYNSIATYQCHPRYLTQGAGNDSIVCQANASWSRHVNCSRVSCGPVSPDPFADIFPLTTSMADEVIYTCKPGSALPNGGVTNNSTCLANGTWSPRDLCFPINCQNPPEDKHANVTKTFKDGNHLVTYTCIENYYIGGTGNMSETISCSSSENWTRHTSCSLADCGPWPADLRATVEESSGTLLYAQVKYKCHEGYTLSGKEDGPTHKTSICLPNRQWTPITYCDGVSEPEYTRAKKMEFPPEEAKHAVAVGSSAIIIVITFVTFIVILDIPAIFRDLRRRLYRNIKSLLSGYF